MSGPFYDFIFLCNFVTLLQIIKTNVNFQPNDQLDGRSKGKQIDHLGKTNKTFPLLNGVLWGVRCAQWCTLHRLSIGMHTISIT